MVKIAPFRPYIPVNPTVFCANPYDVIEPDEEHELKKNPYNVVHLSLPDGEGDTKYQNARNVYEQFQEENIIQRLDKPGIFVYRQESSDFSHQGFIFTVSFEDYEQNRIKKHEKTREKPLQDRIKHIHATHVVPGLVWTVYQDNKVLNRLIEQIKRKKPLLEFDRYNYHQILWFETEPDNIRKLTIAFQELNLYIADGHHRAAAAAAYRKFMLEDPKNQNQPTAPWHNLLVYAASDDQIQILPYNRVVRKISMSNDSFLIRLKDNFNITAMESTFNPTKKHEMGMFFQKQWYQLVCKQPQFESLIDSLDVSLLQYYVLDPILGIKDPRSDENLFFVGGLKNPKEMEKYITDQKNAIFFNLYPVQIQDIEKIADNGSTMPPKSTWFAPKLLSGLIIYPLQE
jgi:uncharacterized protein (DUF1015 family)